MNSGGVVVTPIEIQLEEAFHWQPFRHSLSLPQTASRRRLYSNAAAEANAANAKLMQACSAGNLMHVPLCSTAVVVVQE